MLCVVLNSHSSPPLQKNTGARYKPPVEKGRPRGEQLRPPIKPKPPVEQGRPRGEQLRNPNNGRFAQSIDDFRSNSSPKKMHRQVLKPV